MSFVEIRVSAFPFHFPLHQHLHRTPTGFTLAGVHTLLLFQNSVPIPLLYLHSSLKRPPHYFTSPVLF